MIVCDNIHTNCNIGVVMGILNHKSETGSKIHYGVCPTCSKKTSFDLIGIQKWPKRVAQRLNIPLEQTIWQCRHCETTVMEDSIQFETAS